jgi:DNA ligase 1
MRFDELTRYFQQLEATRGRLKMYQLLGELFSKASADELAEIAYLCEARLGPPFAGVNIGMGERTVAATIQRVTQRLARGIRGSASCYLLYFDIGNYNASIL